MWRSEADGRKEECGGEALRVGQLGYLRIGLIPESLAGPSAIDRASIELE